jgi:OOP family OmpA-OmpF porin
MMRPAKHGLRCIGLVVTAVAILAVLLLPSRGQAAPARDDIVDALKNFDGAADFQPDIAALKQKISDRSKMRGKNEPEPSKRYETVGRLADAMVQANLLSYSFLVVGHTSSDGRREANAMLSQRRADAIRDSLVNTFKISSKRVQSLGLGEEQFVDQAHPTSPANLQIQIVTIGKLPEQSEQPAAKAAPGAAKKKAKKR